MEIAGEESLMGMLTQVAAQSISSKSVGKGHGTCTLSNLGCKSEL